MYFNCNHVLLQPITYLKLTLIMLIPISYETMHATLTIRSDFSLKRLRDLSLCQFVNVSLCLVCVCLDFSIGREVKPVWL